MDEIPEVAVVQGLQTIATMMAIRESVTLIQSLANAGVITSQVVCG